MTKKVKMKPIRAWALTDDFGRLWLDEIDKDGSSISPNRADLVRVRKGYGCPHLWRIVRIEIRELHSQKKKR